MSKIAITGDTHINYDIKKLASKKWKEQRCYTKNDYVIVCGDFGLLWKNIPDDMERYWTKWLNEKRFTTLFVDGNHENFERIKQLPIVDFLGGKAGKVSDSIYHLRRGEIYTINEKTFFCFGGAQSHDKNTRRAMVSWWPEEETNYQETEYALSNLEKVQYKVDYVITHTLPQQVAAHFGYLPWYDKTCSVRIFFDHLRSILTFKKWYCGHFHEDSDRGQYQVLYHKIIEIEKETENEEGIHID